jgi:DNA adenine methylase
MKPLSIKARAFTKTHGGKFYLARRIVELLPDHMYYVEPFAGGLSVLLNKPRCKDEYAYDTNQDLINAWDMIAHYPLIMQRNFQAIGLNEHGMRNAFDATGPGDGALPWRQPGMREIEWAYHFIVRNRMSRGGFGRDFAWQTTRKRGGLPAEVNSWRNFVEGIPALSARVHRVLFFALDGINAIQYFNDQNTLLYVDPPYLPATRTARKAYGDHELSVERHVELLAVLKQTRARVALSGYANDLYDQSLRGWKRIDFDMPNHSSQSATKSRRVESLYLNY